MSYTSPGETRDKYSVASNLLQILENHSKLDLVCFKLMFETLELSNDQNNNELQWWTGDMILCRPAKKLTKYTYFW